MPGDLLLSVEPSRELDSRIGTISTNTYFKRSQRGRSVDVILTLAGAQSPKNFDQLMTPTDFNASLEQHHWKMLDKFFTENEVAITRAEEAVKVEPTNLSDYNTMVDLFESTFTVVLNGLNSLAPVHPVLGK